MKHLKHGIPTVNIAVPEAMIAPFRDQARAEGCTLDYLLTSALLVRMNQFQDRRAMEWLITRRKEWSAGKAPPHHKWSHLPEPWTPYNCQGPCIYCQIPRSDQTQFEACYADVHPDAQECKWNCEDCS